MVDLILVGVLVFIAYMVESTRLELMNCPTCGSPFDVIPPEALIARRLEWHTYHAQTLYPSKCSRCDYPQDAVVYEQGQADGRSQKPLHPEG